MCIETGLQQRLTQETLRSIMTGDMPPDLIAQKLREIREAGGVSGRELVNELVAMGWPITPPELSHYECGRRKMPKGLFDAYITAVQNIVRQRAVAVGVLPAPHKQN